MKRLFVPLNSEPFYDFKDRGKIVEVRNYGRQWTEKNIFEGRPVELRRGYSTQDRIFGTVGKIIVGSLQDILSEFPLKKVEPREKDIEKVLREAADGKYIAFEVLF